MKPEKNNPAQKQPDNDEYLELRSEYARYILNHLILYVCRLDDKKYHDLLKQHHLGTELVDAILEHDEAEIVIYDLIFKVNITPTNILITITHGLAELTYYLERTDWYKNMLTENNVSVKDSCQDPESKLIIDVVESFTKKETLEIRDGQLFISVQI